MKKILQFPASLVKITTKLDGIKFVLETNGHPAPQHTAEMLKLQSTGAMGHFTFVQDRQVEPEDLLDLPALPRTEGKSPSKRLHNTLYVLFKQDNMGYEIFDDFYKHMMEKFIEHVKGKLHE